MRPLGWASPGTDTELIPGGSLFRPGETLRRALGRGAFLAVGPRRGR